jgi:hypothetical protein
MKARSTHWMDIASRKIVATKLERTGLEEDLGRWLVLAVCVCRCGPGFKERSFVQFQVARKLEVLVDSSPAFAPTPRKVDIYVARNHRQLMLRTKDVEIRGTLLELFV